MLTPAHQKKERQERAKPKYTRELDCQIDVSRLEALITEAGDTTWGTNTRQAHKKARTYRESIQSLIKHVTTDPRTGTHTLRLKYTYSDLGRDLFESGHITCSREYAKGEDPFKWPKRMRDAAIGHISVTYDDNAAFPRAKMAMAPVHSRVGKLFLKHRLQVFEQYGKYLFEEEPDAEKRGRSGSSKSRTGTTWAANSIPGQNA